MRKIMELEELDKRITGLEQQVQGQQDIILQHINNHEDEMEELKKILNEMTLNLAEMFKA
ncbi:MAG: hypothetical protein Q4D16_19740 [Eubacteriales bacterium]|nr:hypothetical protein [Eubacteriales bacterium]